MYWLIWPLIQSGLLKVTNRISVTNSILVQSQKKKRKKKEGLLQHLSQGFQVRVQFTGGLRQPYQALIGTRWLFNSTRPSGHDITPIRHQLHQSVFADSRISHRNKTVRMVTHCTKLFGAVNIYKSDILGCDVNVSFIFHIHDNRAQKKDSRQRKKHKHKHRRKQPLRQWAECPLKILVRMIFIICFYDKLYKISRKEKMSHPTHPLSSLST